MPKGTLKQLGDFIRRDLKQLQQSGHLPAEPRYDVRISNSKAGPKVNVTINGAEPLVPGYPDLTVEAIQRWQQTAGAALRRGVEAIRNAYNPDPPTYGGETRFGNFFMSATAGSARKVEI